MSSYVITQSPPLNYANTFSDWVVVTNYLVNMNNNFASNNFVKTSGTFVCADATNALGVNGPGYFYSTLTVSGVGSYANFLTGLTAANITTGPMVVSGNVNVLSGNTFFADTIQANVKITMPTPSNNNNGTSVATTGYVINVLNANSSYNLTAAYTNNAVYTTGSYTNPNWIVSLATNKLTGNIANTVISGLITANQIASVSNTQLTGLIQASQIAVNQLAIANTQLTGIITANQLSGGTIVNSITGTTGQITANTGTGNIQLSLPQNITTASNVQFASIGVGTTPDTANGSIRAINNITAYYSDDRLKTRLGNISNALDKVQQLTGFYYQANDVAQQLGYQVKREVGVSAQEVQKVLPEVVVPAPIDEKYLTVHYDKLIPLLVEAIKELKGEIDDIKSHVGMSK
jgi:hypothetical protein